MNGTFSEKYLKFWTCRDSTSLYLSSFLFLLLGLWKSSYQWIWARIFKKTKKTCPHLSSRTESIGSTPSVSTTWSWSANRIAFSRHSTPSWLPKSTRASLSNLSTRSTETLVGCRRNQGKKNNKINHQSVLRVAWQKCHIMLPEDISMIYSMHHDKPYFVPLLFISGSIRITNKFPAN